MSTPEGNAELLRQVLSPLLEDFHYWFGRSQRLLKEETLEFLPTGAQSDLLERVETAQSELQSAELMYRLADNQVGVDPALVAKWHRLLMECADVGRRFRELHPTPEGELASEEDDREESSRES